MSIDMMMIWTIHLTLLAVLVQIVTTTALTNPQDRGVLNALKEEWENLPPNWDKADPCGDGWDGIICSGDHVVSITLASFNLRGQMSSDIVGLSALEILDLSYNKEMTGPLPSSLENLKKLSTLILVGCGFSGPIPPSIGSLEQLVYLSLNLNNFAGAIPPSIGLLSNLRWLDLADNMLTGTIPVSNGSEPGLDMLVHTKHFHFGNNKLSGEIPSQLFTSNMTLIHLLLEGNQLTGSIPSTLGLVRTLEVVRLDRNSLSGSVPENINSLSSVQTLYLANNKLTGPVPDLSGMDVLNYVDLSNNSFDATSVPPWFSSLMSLSTLIMDKTGIQGELPTALFGLSQLQTVSLRNNRVNGTLNIGPSYSSQLHLIDLQNNLVDAFTPHAGNSIQIILVGNPICDEGGTETYCIITQKPNSSYSTPAENCVPMACMASQVSSPKCKCAHPYTGNLEFRAPLFSNYGNSTRFELLQQKLMDTFWTHGLPVDSVSLSNLSKILDNYLAVDLQIFPSGQDYFNRTGISGIAFMLSNQTFKPPHEFGPFFFKANRYAYFEGSSVVSKKSESKTIILGAAIGGSVLFLLLVLAGIYAFIQQRRAETASKKNNPFASWNTNTDSGGVPQPKGIKFFSFEELKKCTNNFSDGNDLGKGGYGKVYRGVLPNGKLVAIKRAQKGSIQGGLEFKNEIELLSRVHHKNVVALVGFCFEQGEQLLVYEYIANGSLKDNLSGKTGTTLDWTRRLRISLGAARGLQYLHDLANPPIIHRDIKSNNILLDERLNAKVSDFGLSKLVGDPEKGHVTTQVKGTMGYLDPEYYMTQQLTEKSDVYSFGVLLLELITARSPIEKGKYIVREVKQAMDKAMEMYNLQALLDPNVILSITPRSLENFVDLALGCTRESGDERPTMVEVVKEIENVMVLAGLNPHMESASSSTSYEGASKGNDHPYSNETIFSYSAGNLPSKLDSK